MYRKMLGFAAFAAALCGFAGSAAAQAWSPEQQEVWQLEQQQWKMSTAKDVTWIDSMVHPNMRYWETNNPMPRDKASLKHWARYQNETTTTLIHELFPIAIAITGNVAVVQYHYMMANENLGKERETVTGRYTDVLVKENGRWMFIAWAGGDDSTD